MKKKFNNEHTLKSSENCDKYSKSVSYETLVGGTTTTGTGIKQTRRLSKCSANKPLSAVGTLTSLLCNSAKVVEKWLQISPVLRLVKVLGLVLVLSFTIITESFAECMATENNWINTCFDSWNPGIADNCGDGCTYTYNNGKLTVTATKPDAVIPRYMFSPLYYEDGIFPNVKDIEISGKFDIIDANAFYANQATISGKDGILYVKDVINVAFAGNTLVGTIIVDEKKQRLGTEPWYSATLNATVILPPTIKSISGWALYGLSLGPNAKIYCGAENCEELFKNVDCEGFSTKETYRTQCKNNLKTLLTSGKLLAYPDGCTKMGATGCTKCKNENFKLNDGECDRLRWTPAEAAEVLTDDNNNSVTITFKK